MLINGKTYSQQFYPNKIPSFRLSQFFYVAHHRDIQTKQIQDNITNVEKHFGDLCQLFAAYVRKSARLRDKADLLVKEVGLYADTETPNLKCGLKNFADQLAKIQDYRQAEVCLKPQKHSLAIAYLCFLLICKRMLLFTGGEAGSESYRAFESIWEYCENKKGKVFFISPSVMECK